MITRSAAPAAPTPVQQTNNTAAQLQKYKELLDSGVISNEDYEAKKKQLLGL
ncbi:MAG: SHOCT domain-containing protein [Clostridia bacterium]|nr:SHOCT domain-containing protein [Clostridia bacterium]